MIPRQWAPPCNNQCTHKYAALTQIPWRVFCKKGCNSNGDSWEECLDECDEICYKDPVLKDQPWSAYIDRSPGSACYSEECFRACISGCSYKLHFDVPSDEVDQVPSKRPSKPPILEQPAPPVVDSRPPSQSNLISEVVPGTSAWPDRKF